AHPSHSDSSDISQENGATDSHTLNQSPPQQSHFSPSLSVYSSNSNNNSEIAHTQNIRRRTPRFGGTSRSPYVNRNVTINQSPHDNRNSSSSSQNISGIDLLNQKISQGLKWYREAQDRKIVCLPKLDRDKRKLISQGLADLFKYELIPLIEEFNPDSLDIEDNNLKWIIFEGAFEEMLHRIRMHIAIKLNLNPDRIYKKKKKSQWINKIHEEITSIQMRTKMLSKLAADIDKINNHDDGLSESEANHIKSRIIRNISLIQNEDRAKLFGTTDTFLIADEIVNNNNQCSTRFGEWIETTINELIKSEMGIKAANRQAERIRNSYSDNPKRTLNNFILARENPECLIDQNTLCDYFSRSFQQGIDVFTPDDQDGIFSLNNCFSDVDRTDFMLSVLDKKLIDEVISTRKYDSAAGPDGIDYSIYKLAKTDSVNMIHLLIKIIINAGRVPMGWKRSNMNLIYKKNDVNDPANWRPISISNALYRIISCVFARCINKFNNKLEIFSKNQRGFIETINGCADNANIISELYYDAMRHNR
ncbi:MAG: hypothetical protein K2L13_01770, partial [Opitutales bacterium]|nr:hypothetical protein [Opitutales bacterium]